MRPNALANAMPRTARSLALSSVCVDQTHPMKTVRLRHAVRADLPTIVDIWVDAFTDDPYFRWVQPDDDRWPAFGTAWLTFIAAPSLS